MAILGMIPLEADKVVALIHLVALLSRRWLHCVTSNRKIILYQYLQYATCLIEVLVYQYSDGQITVEPLLIYRLKTDNFYLRYMIWIKNSSCKCQRLPEPDHLPLTLVTGHVCIHGTKNQLFKSYTIIIVLVLLPSVSAEPVIMLLLPY